MSDVALARLKQERMRIAVAMARADQIIEHEQKELEALRIELDERLLSDDEREE